MEDNQHVEVKNVENGDIDIPNNNDHSEGSSSSSEETNRRLSVEIIGKTRSRIVNGRYYNPFDPDALSGDFFNKLKFFATAARPKPLTKHEKEVVHPVLPVDLNRLATEIPSSVDASTGRKNQLGCRVTWIGHSSFYIQTNSDGISFLTDPVWSDRASPVGFAGPKRFRDVPCKIRELPRIDFVVISHNHYDHLCIEAVKTIANNAKWFIPKGLGVWFESCGVNNYTELEWWEESIFNNRIRITCTPCNHWSLRTLTDRNKALWCSWAIVDIETDKKFWFAGDTAVCKAFKEIGQHFGSIDYALIPIGAYHPREQFSRQHIDPAQAVQIFQEVRAKRCVGIHWGTFQLTFEPLLEPMTLLREECDKVGVTNDQFFTMKIGESIDYQL